MVSVLFVEIMLHVGCFLDFLLTRRIIQNGEHQYYSLGILLMRLHFRILLACIRFLGRCPCPRCLVLKSQVPDMGTKYDRKRQSENFRKDTTFVQMLIAKARKLIFEVGKSIASKAVECKIYTTSLLPTRVRHNFIYGHFSLN